MADETVVPNQGTGPGDHPGGGHTPTPFDQGGGGSGPGDHPGVTIIALLGDTSADANSIETALESGRNFVFVYQVGGSTFAVFASAYK